MTTTVHSYFIVVHIINCTIYNVHNIYICTPIIIIIIIIIIVVVGVVLLLLIPQNKILPSQRSESVPVRYNIIIKFGGGPYRNRLHNDSVNSILYYYI